MRTNWSPAVFVPAALVGAWCNTAQPVLTQGVAQAMDPYIHLYQFTRARNPIGLGRITSVQVVRPGPPDGDETLDVGVDIIEALWQEVRLGPRTFHVRRPVSLLMRVKAPDPVWGRVTLEQGVRILIVWAPPPGSADNPVYVDQLAEPNDPVLIAIRSVLDIERSVHDRAALLQRRFAQLRGGPVEQLFAGEALASDGPFRPDEQSLIAKAISQAYADAKDDSVKIGLGSWLWDSVYPQTDRAGRASALSATIRVATSGSETVRMFALDRLADADPRTVHETGVKGTPALLALLEDRRRQESDDGVRRRLEELIAALR